MDKFAEEGISLGDRKITPQFQRNKYWARWTRSIYVANLNWNAEEWHLDEFFQDCGEILDIRIARHPDGRSKGFAFMEFLDRRATNRSLYKDTSEFLGRSIRVNLKQKPLPR